MAQKGRSLILTTLVFVLSTMLSGYGYIQIVKDRSSYLSGIEIPVLPQSFTISQQNRCVGEIKTFFEVTPDGQDLHLAVSLNGSNGSFQGVFSFNDLGQLIASESSFNGEGGSLTIGTANVNPIRTVLKGTAFQKPFRFEFELPGPIQLVRKKNSVIIAQPRGKIFANVDQPHQMLESFSMQITSEKSTCTSQGTLTIPGDLFGFLGTFQQALQEGKLSW